MGDMRWFVMVLVTAGLLASCGKQESKSEGAPSV
jgi:hypothetical protein